MVMFLLSFVKGSKFAERGPNPLADMDPGGPILGGPNPLGHRLDPAAVASIFCQLSFVRSLLHFYFWFDSSNWSIDISLV